MDGRQGAAQGQGERVTFEQSDNRLTPVWRAVVTDLEPSLSQQQRAWLGLTQPVGLLGTTALLAAPTDFAKEAIERTLREAITTALSDRLHQQISLAVTVADGAMAPMPPPTDRRPPPDRFVNGPSFATNGDAGQHRAGKPAPGMEKLKAMRIMERIKHYTDAFELKGKNRRI